MVIFFNIIYFFWDSLLLVNVVWIRIFRNICRMLWWLWYVLYNFFRVLISGKFWVFFFLKVFCVFCFVLLDKFMLFISVVVIWIFWLVICLFDFVRWFSVENRLWKKMVCCLRLFWLLKKCLKLFNWLKFWLYVLLKKCLIIILRMVLGIFKNIKLNRKFKIFFYIVNFFCIFFVFCC